MNGKNFGGLFGKANLREIAKELYLDSFIISYFKILPTDEKYKALSDEQKTLLYYMVVFSPSGETLRKMGLSWLKQDDLEIGKNEENMLNKLGLDVIDIKGELNKMENEVFK